MRPLYLLGILLMFASPQPSQASSDALNVAVTIKPLHSLVAGIMKGAGEPELIMASGASPHHYTLRPSERRILSRASLIFWIGPELESFMPKILDSLAATSTNIPLIDAENLLRLPARSIHHHSETEAEEHAHADPHIWLSAKNAHALVDAIADELIRQHAAQAQIYEANRRRLHRRIEVIDQLIDHRLSGKTAPFLSYHDAYQYFERAYGLNNAGFVSSGDEVSPGARYVNELRNRIRDEQLHCLFYEAPSRPALVDTLIHGLNVSALEIDALGVRLEAGENAWFEIMLGLTEAYESCL
ncbi:MAG: zinc ABC transporter substrate-binding protein [Thiotrichales bacterium]|nr:MAG: zinc ABC transporter substrate-binding protein [Thiotrichales bacterium]